MGGNMNGLINPQMIVRVEFAKNSKQVHIVGRGLITVIYKMFCNGRPVCFVYPVSKVVSLPYFRGYMLFNSWIQTLICSLDVSQNILVSF